MTAKSLRGMKRKIYKLGKSTLVVSLPSKWAKKYKISSKVQEDNKYAR